MVNLSIYCRKIGEKVLKVVKSVRKVNENLAKCGVGQADRHPISHYHTNITLVIYLKLKLDKFKKICYTLYIKYNII